MRLRLAIDGVDFSDVTEASSLSITQDSTQAVSTALFRVIQKAPPAQGSGGRYDVSLYDESVYGWTVDEWQEVRIWDGHTGEVLFGGFVLGVQRQPAGKHMWFQCACSDYGILLDRRVITKTWPAGTADSTVFIEALAQVPEISVGQIETIVADLGVLEMKDQRIRDLFDAVSTLTGGEYYTGYDGKVDYYKIGSIMAPFDLSDDFPNGIGTVPFQVETYTHDFSDGANDVLVLGAITNGVEITGSAKDDASIAKYGPLEDTLPNRQITDTVTANLYAATQVAERSMPKEILKVWLTKPGLARGQTVNVYSLRLGILAPYVIRTLNIALMGPDYVELSKRRELDGVPLSAVSAHLLKYTASLGQRPPDMVYQLRRMQRWPVDSTKLPFSGASTSFQIGDGRTVTIRGGIIAEVK